MVPWEDAGGCAAPGHDSYVVCGGTELGDLGVGQDVHQGEGGAFVGEPGVAVPGVLGPEPQVTLAVDRTRLREPPACASVHPHIDVTLLGW